MSKQKFLKIIETQRRGKKKQKFEGTFLDYLDVVNKDPSVVQLAHRRLSTVIGNHGIEEMPDSDPRKRKIFDGENVKLYKYFENEFLVWRKSLVN